MPRYARPAPREFSPFYAEYIASVPDGDVLDVLEAQHHEVVALLRPLSTTQWHSRYAPGKWSVSEILGHLGDAERILSYRALRFGRGDQTPLAGFEEDDYVPPAQFDGRNPESLLAEYEAIRGSTLALFRHLPNDAPERIGTANGAEVSVRALLYIITGHERHHVRVLRGRYL